VVSRMRVGMFLRSIVYFAKFSAALRGNDSLR
jgi:hypothetical protein